MLIEVLFTGTFMGCIYTLIGLGFNLIFNSSQIFNFAQGEFLMLGAMFYVTFNNVLHFPLAITFLLCSICVGIVGLLLELGPIRYLADKEPPIIRLILVTLAFGIIVKNAAELIWGKYPVRTQGIATEENLILGGHVFMTQGFYIIIFTIIILFFLWFLFKRTLSGKAFLASAYNKDMAYLCGINVKSMLLISFVASGLLGGVAGALISPVSHVSTNMGALLGLKGFMSAVIGGMGNPIGAILGGLIIGFSEQLVGTYISTRLMEVFPFLILIVVLVNKPHGLIPSNIND